MISITHYLIDSLIRKGYADMGMERLNINAEFYQNVATYIDNNLIQLPDAKSLRKFINNANREALSVGLIDNPMLQDLDLKKSNDILTEDYLKNFAALSNKIAASCKKYADKRQQEINRSIWEKIPSSTAIHAIIFFAAIAIDIVIIPLQSLGLGMYSLAKYLFTKSNTNTNTSQASNNAESEDNLILVEALRDPQQPGIFNEFGSKTQPPLSATVPADPTVDNSNQKSRTNNSRPA